MGGAAGKGGGAGNGASGPKSDVAESGGLSEKVLLDDGSTLLALDEYYPRVSLVALCKLLRSSHEVSRVGEWAWERLRGPTAPAEPWCSPVLLCVAVRCCRALLPCCFQRARSP